MEEGRRGPSPPLESATGHCSGVPISVKDRAKLENCDKFHFQIVPTVGRRDFGVPLKGVLLCRRKVCSWLTAPLV